MSEAGSERNENPQSSAQGTYGVEDGHTKRPQQAAGQSPGGRGWETNSKLPPAQHPEEVTQSRHKCDAAPHSEAPSHHCVWSAWPGLPVTFQTW